MWDSTRENSGQVSYKKHLISDWRKKGHCMPSPAVVDSSTAWLLLQLLSF